jgi:hypothetical protein
MSKKYTQDPVKQEDLHKFLEYVMTGQVQDEKHAKWLNKMSRRTVTLSDITVVAQVINDRNSQLLTSVMSMIQIQSAVLKKLGATDEMIAEAEKEYNESIAERRKAIADAQKQLEEGVQEEEVTEDKPVEE